MLTPKQRRFVDEYLVDLNATQAAIRAGYSENGSRVAGHRLLTHPEVQDALREAQRGLADRTGITADRVLAELAKIGFSDIRKAVTWRNLPHRVLTDPDTGEMVIQAGNEVTLVDSGKLDDATAGAIAEVSQTKEGTLKLKLYDKRGALVEIGRHLGMFRPASRPAGDDDAAMPADKNDGWGDDLTVN